MKKLMPEQGLKQSTAQWEDGTGVCSKNLNEYECLWRMKPDINKEASLWGSWLETTEKGKYSFALIWHQWRGWIKGK